MANPKSPKKPNVGQKPTAGSMGDDSVTTIATTIPTKAPVNMNDQIRGARRMVTSVLVIPLLFQNREGHEFGQRRAGAGRANRASRDSRVPRFRTDGERHERHRIELDDVRRSSACVTESLNNLDSAVRRNPHLDGFPGDNPRKLLEDEPDGDCGCFPIDRTVPNGDDGRSTAFDVDSGKGHAQHASSGEGRVFT